MTAPTPSTPSPSTPAGAAARALAPDLARGLMLLLIALAHAPGFIGDWDLGPRFLDAPAQFVRSLLAENQARVLFVLLFGYGAGQIVRRRAALGAEWPTLRRLLRRRGFWLVAIGFAHAVLLVPLDIVAVYGLTLLVLAPLVRARDSVLLWTAAATLPFGVAMLAWQGATALAAAAAGTPITMARYMAADYDGHVLASLPEWPVETLVSTVTVVPGMLVGVWAARRRILEEPRRHTPLLWRLTLGCGALALLCRLPLALLVSGLWTAPSAAVDWAVTAAHTLGGHAGGVAMAAAVGLAALRIADRPGPTTAAVAALGERSLTFYLFQSAVWLALFYPFTLALHDDVGFAGACAIAVALWAVSVVLADLLRRTGRRGPAEVLLRRLVYGRPRAAAPAPGTPPTAGAA